METVQSAAASAQGAAAAAYNTASKMIFGENPAAESGEEPVSGGQGEGSTTSAFDQGNQDDGAAPGSSSRPALGESVQQKEESGQEPRSGLQGRGTASEPFDLGNKYDGAAAGQSTSDTQTSASSSSAGTASQGLPLATSSAGLAERASPVVKEPGTDRSTAAPIGGQQDAVKASKDAAEEAMAKKDPDNQSDDPLGSHRGFGAVVDNTAEGGNDLSGEAIKAKATGDKYVKSTGLAADGGDFDASKPGAGAEASRLMEEKSVEKEDGKHQDVDSNAGGVAGLDDAKAKPKLSERIKDKLHIHKH